MGKIKEFWDRQGYFRMVLLCCLSLRRRRKHHPCPYPNLDPNNQPSHRRTLTKLQPNPNRSHHCFFPTIVQQAQMIQSAMNNQSLAQFQQQTWTMQTLTKFSWQAALNTCCMPPLPAKQLLREFCSANEPARYGPFFYLFLLVCVVRAGWGTQNGNECMRIVFSISNLFRLTLFNGKE